MEENNFLEIMNNNRKEKEKEVRNKLIDIFNNSDEEVKLLISMLIQTEYSLAIQKDNYNRLARQNDKTVKEMNFVKDYEKENKELIEKVWWI